MSARISSVSMTSASPTGSIGADLLPPSWIGANDVDLGYKIYTSSDANGTLVFEYHEYDTVVVLQMARNALNQFYLLNYMTEDYDNSTDKGTYVLNGAASTYKKYSAALKKMQKGSNLKEETIKHSLI